MKMPHATTPPTMEAPLTEAPVPVGVESSSARPPRPRKPDYYHIHRNPLPIKIHPLPPLIPHNPLSILHIAVVYLSQILYPPKRPAPYKAYFDVATSSVQVTDPETMRALWEMGFFGKGSLSRSEPTWLEREQKRRGVGGRGTNEEATGKRRAERRGFKLDRAKKEQEAIAEKLKAETKLRNEEISSTIETVLEDEADEQIKLSNGHTNGHLNGNANGHLDSRAKSPTRPLRSRTSSCLSGAGSRDDVETTPDPLRKRGASLKSVRFSPTVEAREFDLSGPTLAPIKPSDPITSSPDRSTSPIKIPNQEYYHLTSEEAFFLVYGLGVLEVHLPSIDTFESTTVLGTDSLLPLFRRISYSPPLSLSSPLSPSDPFLLSYIAYHHFRSLGWVVRSGIKFAVDYLLYNRGPPFAHAEFAVVIVPGYTHAFWTETEEGRREVEERQKGSDRGWWWWLHGVNRVQAQVRKSLVMCYVDVPPPALSSEPGTKGDLDIGALLSSYKVREVIVKRWIPNRSRD